MAILQPRDCQPPRSKSIKLVLVSGVHAVCVVAGQVDDFRHADGVVESPRRAGGIFSREKAGRCRR